jgi:hypothetical protein
MRQQWHCRGQGGGREGSQLGWGSREEMNKEKGVGKGFEISHVISFGSS